MIKKFYKYIDIKRLKQVLTLCCLLLLSIVNSSSNSYAREISNSEVKASWIYTVIEWIEWYDVEETTTRVICTVGRDKVHMYLKRTKTGYENEIGGISFIIDRKNPKDNFDNCDILYISDSEQEFYLDILDKLKGKKGILTIS
ncbi:MAG: YfiR family protein, partial [Proteobacteria bacterium]|nr:YfiR family protein [Pseudomonadota bacterium]